MTLNLLFLGLIVLIPFSTNLMSDYSEVPEAAAVFSTTIALASLANWTMVAYTLRRGYVSEDLMHQARPYGNWLGLSFTALFLVSIPAAFIDTTVAQVLWVAAIVVRYPLRRVADRGRRPRRRPGPPGGPRRPSRSSARARRPRPRAGRAARRR